MGIAFCFAKNVFAYNIIQKIIQKTIDKPKKWSYNTYQNLNITKNDCDEDGRIEDPGESCRLVRGNGGAFQ